MSIFEHRRGIELGESLISAWKTGKIGVSKLTRLQVTLLFHGPCMYFRHTEPEYR